MIDWKTVWKDAVAAAEAVVSDRAPKAKGYVKDIVKAREKRIKLLLIALADGALDEATIEAELREEQAILESELLAVRVMVKKAAQDAANALIGTIQKALLDGIRLVA